jgi:hypothetical protein
MYLIYPKKSGSISLEFELIKSLTDDDKVAYAISGDRDNVKGLVTVDTKIDLPPLKLNVKALPKGTLLVGDFTLNSKFTKHEISAYEPIPFEVSIKGTGYPPVLKNILKQSNDFTLFKENPIVKTIHSKESTRSTVTYPMALSAAKSFEFKELSIKAFNPKTATPYTLHIPKQNFVVKKEDISLLVDKEDNPKSFSTDYSWLTSFLSYLIVFVSGYFSAIIYRNKKRVIHTSKKDPFVQRIDDCRNEKELFTLLLANDSKKHAKVIEKLEHALYKKVKRRGKKRL